MQDGEIPDELKRYVSRLPSLVLGSKAKNTDKNYMFNFKQFSYWCQNMVTNQYQLPIIMWENIYHI